MHLVLWCMRQWTKKEGYVVSIQDFVPCRSRTRDEVTDVVQDFSMPFSAILYGHGRHRQALQRNLSSAHRDFNLILEMENNGCNGQIFKEREGYQCENPVSWN